MVVGRGWPAQLEVEHHNITLRCGELSSVLFPIVLVLDSRLVVVMAGTPGVAFII